MINDRVENTSAIFVIRVPKRIVSMERRELFPRFPCVPALEEHDGKMNRSAACMENKLTQADGLPAEERCPVARSTRRGLLLVSRTALWYADPIEKGTGRWTFTGAFRPRDLGGGAACLNY